MHNCTCAYLFSLIPLGGIHVYITIFHLLFMTKGGDIRIYFIELSI